MLRIFGHYIPTSLVVLVLVEILVLYASVFVGVEIRFFNVADKELSVALIGELNFKAFVFTMLMMFSMTAMGLHTRNVAIDSSAMMIRIAMSFAIGFFVISFSFYLYPQFFLGRGIIGITFVVSFLAILSARLVHQRIDKHSIFKRRILVLGAGKKALQIENLLATAKKQGFEVVRFIDVDLNEPKISLNRLVGIKTTLHDLCADLDIDEIILAMDDRRKKFPTSGLIECKMQGIVINDFTDFLERINGHIDIEALQPSSIIFSNGFTNAVRVSSAKRLFDIVISLIILIVSSPAILLTAVIIWLSSFGKDSVLYRQVRVGLNNKPFNVLKFRSMSVDAEKNGAQFAKKNDARVTKVGSFIRKTRIDELPQLFNVLKGDMSFIGPRPERPQFILGFEQNIPHYSLRHSVKPGITGWAQICYPYGDTDEDTKNKLQYDLYYIKNYSLFLDLTIALQTVQVVLFGQGAR